MNEIPGSLTSLSAGAAGALFSAIWEGAVLALGVSLGLRLFPRLSAAARSVVWLNVFVLLVLLHFVPVFASQPTAAANAHLPAIHLDLRWSLAVVALWLALSTWRAAQMMIGVVHLRRLARRAVPVATGAELKALLADAPGRRAAVLCTSGEVSRPSVLGFFRPRVLLPPALVAELTAQELQQVVVHEMEHLRRGDDWTNLMQKFGLVLFPLNPVLLWVERRLCAERELACDDRVICSSAGRKAYALCLTRLAELSLFRRGFSLVLGLWERRPELVRRVQRIVSQPVRTMGRRPAMVATGGVLAGALGCAIALSHSPQLVSFLPAHPAMLQASSFDPHEVARQLGGTPQLTKALVQAGSEIDPSGAKALRRVALVAARLKSCPFKAADNPACESTGRAEALQHGAVLKAVQHWRAAGSRIANVTPPSAPVPALNQRELIVLTEVTTFQAPPRVVLTVSRGRRVAPAVAIPAAYAIVPVPNGWLIIQI